MYIIDIWIQTGCVGIDCGLWHVVFGTNWWIRVHIGVRKLL